MKEYLRRTEVDQEFSIQLIPHICDGTFKVLSDFFCREWVLVLMQWLVIWDLGRFSFIGGGE